MPTRSDLPVFTQRSHDAPTPLVDFRYRAPHILSPYSELMRKWDIAIVVAMLYVATITMFEVSIISDPSVLLQLCNLLLDLLFLTDMGLQVCCDTISCARQMPSVIDECAICVTHWRTQFFLGFYSRKLNMLVFHHPTIIKRYLSTWFTLDLISIFPFELAFTGKFAFAGSHDSKNAAGLRKLRVVRLLRLFKVRHTEICDSLELCSLSTSESLQGERRCSLKLSFGLKNGLKTLLDLCVSSLLSLREKRSAS